MPPALRLPTEPEATLRREHDRLARQLDRLRREERDLEDQIRRAREQVRYYDDLIRKLKADWTGRPGAGDVVRNLH
ncbi:MAG: hypothetical protein QXG65_00720 [Thermoplasmata archaeon]